MDELFKDMLDVDVDVEEDDDGNDDGGDWLYILGDVEEATVEEESGVLLRIKLDSLSHLWKEALLLFSPAVGLPFRDEL